MFFLSHLPKGAGARETITSARSARVFEQRAGGKWKSLKNLPPPTNKLSLVRGESEAQDKELSQRTNITPCSIAPAFILGRPQQRAVIAGLGGVG